MSREGKKYHIDEVRGGRGVTLCAGQRVHLITVLLPATTI